MTLDEILDRGKRTAENLLGRALDYFPPYRTLKDMLEATAESERELMELAHRIKDLDAIGYATQADFDAWNTMRRNVTGLQSRLLDATRRVFFDRPEVLSRLPRTTADWPPLLPTNVATLMPGRLVTELAPAGSSASAELGRGTSGLGNLSGPEVAAPLAAIPQWMICAIILAAIVATAVVGYAAATSIGVTVESISNVLIIKEQIRGLRVTVEGRLQIYQSCMAEEGATPEQCARIAVSTVPTPREAAIPVAPPGGWIKWVAIGIGVTGVIALGGYLIYKRETSSSLRGAERASYRPIREAKFPYERSTDRGLPV